ncbi:type I restriction endonuclease [Sorangium sp. So ce295]|uniref:type I restriction endonuclease n=1 Tax=Sorangium sp. So ce295 TaxID=3133295 RepID=UPI003F6089CC
MALIDNMRRLAEQVRKRLPNTIGEEATKNALVMPFLGALGYDVFDPTEVRPEYVADFAKKKSNGQFEKVDYAIYINGVPVMFIECKPADAEPNTHSGQLSRYFNSTPSVKVAVVTNGVRYMFFTDLEEPNIMGERPFFEFNVLEFTERDVETLDAFSKDNFDAGTVRTRAEDIIFTGRMTAYINDVLRNPTEEFTRFILGELNITTGKLTAKRVEKFIPIVRKAIQTTLLDMATRSIRQETQDVAVAAPPPPPPIPQPPPQAAPPSRDSAPEQGKGVVTTQEELDAYEVIRRICADSPAASKAQVHYRDAVNYFGINIGNTKKWFVRLFFDGKRKSMVTKVPADRATLLAPGFEVDVPSENVGKSRVYVSGLKDLERLRPLLMLAFEDEIRRAESGDAPEEEESPAGVAMPH